MGIATFVALTGNIQISLPGHTNSPFAWLEAVAPPLLVLSTAYVLKEQVLETIEQRHADERAFQLAFAEWQAATSGTRTARELVAVLCQCAADAIFKVNSRRKETLSDMSVADWRASKRRKIVGILSSITGRIAEHLRVGPDERDRYLVGRLAQNHRNLRR